MSSDKHPTLWRFLAENWDKIVTEYETARKEHGFYNMMFSSHSPEYKFDEKNWKLIEKETGLKGLQINLGIDNPNAIILRLIFDYKNK